MSDPSLVPTAPPPPRACRRCGETSVSADGLCRRCVARAVFGAALDLEPLPNPATGAAGIPSHALSDYEILEELGRGGMGVVYRARQKGLDREVALKILRDCAVNDGTGADRFRAEATAAASLQHPNIVAIHGFGEEDGQPFYSMELIPGQDLAALTREGPLPARRAAQFMATIARAIQHAHDRGLLHRDLKGTSRNPNISNYPLPWCFTELYLI